MLSIPLWVKLISTVNWADYTYINFLSYITVFSIYAKYPFLVETGSVVLSKTNYITLIIIIILFIMVA